MIKYYLFVADDEFAASNKFKITISWRSCCYLEHAHIYEIFSMTRFLLSTDKRFSRNFGRLMGHLFLNCQLFSLLACCLRFFDMLFVNDRHVTYLSLFINHANHEQFSMEIWKQFSTALVILQCALWLI